MKSKKILACIVAVLMIVCLLPYHSVGHVHTHALELICEHNYMTVEHKPTCTEDGYTEYLCTKLCGERYIESGSTVAATGHSLNSEGVCKNCGKNRNFAPGDLNADGLFAAADLVVMKEVLLAVENDVAIVGAGDCDGDYIANLKDMVRLKKHVANDVGSGPFTYEINEDGEAVITDFDGSVSGAITIPSEIDGYPVAAIGDSVFENSTNITSVLIPNTVDTIGDNAFAGCENLKGTALPNSVDSIGNYAFSECKSMPTMRLSDNIEEIGEGAFSFCSSLIELNIPEKVTVLNNSAFKGCSSLVFVGLPENLKEIKTYTFYGCEKLESVSIPITVVEVGNNAFDSCESLLSVVVPYETAFGANVFSNCPKLVVKGFAGSGNIDAVVNSGVNVELMECGHSEFIMLYAVNPTCAEGGYSGDKYCIGCGKIEVKGTDIPQTGHIPELRGKKDVTCEEDGYTGDTVCTACGLYIDRGYTQLATGHYAESMPGYVDATCTETGKYGTFTCEYCNEYIDNLTIPAKGHNKYYKNQKTATCLEDGYSGDYACLRCGEVFSYGKILPKGNHYYLLYDYKEATCTENGYSGDSKCIACGTVRYYGTVTTKVHTPVTSNYKAATCTENGYSGDSECADCGIALSTGKELPLLGHTSVLINYSEPTCTENGYTGDQICSVCKVFVSTGNATEKLGHKPALKNQQDCTETEEGYTGDWVCEVCGAVTEEGRVIPANHEHTMEVTGKKAATCTEEGYTGDSTCTVCGYSVLGTVDPIKPHECTTETVEVSCTAEGYTVDKCNNCDYENKYDIEEALGHDWDKEWTVDKAATCTEDGSQQKNCSRCDEKQIEIIKAAGHTEGELINAKAPTCSEEGYTGDSTCLVCGEVAYGTSIPAKEHNYSEWETRCFHKNNSGDPTGGMGDDFAGGMGDDMMGGDIFEEQLAEEYAEEYRICADCQYEETNRLATERELYSDIPVYGSCTSDGSITYSCKYCDYSYTDVLPAPGHNYYSEITDPTCTQQGYTTYICYNCSDSYVSDYVDALGHNFENGICTNCDEIEEIKSVIISTEHNYGNNEDEWWEYTFTNAGFVTITFSKNSCTEQGFDNIYIYDGNGTLIEIYSGYDFGGQTVKIPGNAIKVNFVSDGFSTFYGFDAEISPEYIFCSCGALLYDFSVEQEVSCFEDGIMSKICEICGEKSTLIISAKGEHDWNSDTGYCNTCDIECDHMSDDAGGLCIICGKTSCPNCWGDFSHDAADCPNMGPIGGTECPYCGMPHMEPMECPMWCHICNMPHMDPMECPMNNGMGGEM